MLLVLAFGGLLVVSLVLTTILSSLAQFAPDAIDGIVPRAELINTAVSAIVMFLLFAMIFKWLPDVKIAWSDVWAGAAVTSLLFLVGKEVLAVYLTHVGAASIYGAGKFAGPALAVGLLLVADFAAGRRAGARLCGRSRLARRGGEDARDGRWDELRLQCRQSRSRGEVALCRVTCARSRRTGLRRSPATAGRPATVRRGRHGWQSF